MAEQNTAKCEHKGSLFLETHDQGGYRVRCGTCWFLGPEREEPRHAVSSFKEAQRPPPGAESTPLPRTRPRQETHAGRHGREDSLQRPARGLLRVQYAHMGENRSEGSATERFGVTVAEAADILSITAEAVRTRIKRGKLDSTKNDGTVYVLLSADPATMPGFASVALAQSLTLLLG